MRLYDYLGIDATEFQAYIDSRMISVNHHDKFPLVLFSYSRQAQHENLWPEPVRKCRGLIVREDTEEIIARPFEKFFNYGDPNCGYDPPYTEEVPGGREPDFIFEKMDGFMCTLYTWEGVNYIASKGSFDSPHAKWATAMYKAHESRQLGMSWPEGFTPVFEGLTANLRIVVDYGTREELVLIGLVNIETGEEVTGHALQRQAGIRGFASPTIFNYKLATANTDSLSPLVKNFEGYVAVWVRPGQTPFRLKIKYLDYLRIHRMVTGVSPKRVLEALVNGWQSVLDEWTNESTPWFNKHIWKWKNALEAKFGDYCDASALAFDKVKKIMMAPRLEEGKFDYLPTRKQWALEFQKYPDLAPILFAMLDGKDTKPIIWKMVKPLIRNSKPMVDSHSI